jgi:plastocyanin
MEELQISQGKISLLLPYMEQSARGSVVLGWYGCITCTRWSKLVHIDATGYVTVTAPGDMDASNNSASATMAKSVRSPVIGAFMDYTDDSCMDHIVTGRAVTNQSMLELRGRAEPNRIIAILIGLVQVGTATSDNNGNFSYPVNLAEGVYRISARYPEQLQRQTASSTAPFADGLILEVKPALPFDPMSVCFVDSRQRSYFVPMLGRNMDDISDGNYLRSGETYTVSLRGAVGAVNTYVKITFEDILISDLLDGDGNGFYTGKFTVPENVQAAEVNARRKLGLVVRQGSTATTFTSYIDTATDGVIRDRGTGLPLAGATVAALVAEEAEDGSVIFGEWPAGDSGQPNPQTTAADGKYGYSATTGVYRLQVERAGYQPYRSGDIDAASVTLARDIALSPLVADPTTQTIYITDQGFVPATVTVAPGSVVEFVNLAFDERGSTGAGWDSGLLHAGQGFKVKLTAEGAYAYSDSAAPLSQATITVAAGAGVENLYLPLVGR